MIASFSRRHIAPIPFNLSAVTGFPSRVYATTIRDSLFLRSAMSLASARIALISLATVMSKPLSLGTPPLLRPPRPTTMFLSSLQFMSRAFLNTIFVGSMFCSFFFVTWFSVSADRRL